jgi:ATP-dependent RNA helicase DeaD
VHRTGRTGRAAPTGDAISYVTPRERHLLRSIERTTRQPLTQMDLPSVDDVNTTRLARFDGAITEALSSERVEFFRDVVSHYVREHNVPEVDVAAALAVVLQGDTPLLLEPEPQRPARGERPQRAERADRAGQRPEPRTSRRYDEAPLATYRIAVGKRHKVEPRQIVGALANEGGLNRRDFGHISIRPDFSLVELPAELPPGTEERLAGTRISGKLIALQRDSGPPSAARTKKPRHKG